MATKPMQAFKELVLLAAPELTRERVWIGTAPGSMDSPWAHVLASGGVVGDKQDALQHRRIDLRVYSKDQGQADEIAERIDAWFEDYGGGVVDAGGAMTAVLSVDPESGPYHLVDPDRFAQPMVYRTYNMEYTEAA